MKKMRKSSLITSLMVIVAVIASISVATFAWFTVNDTATAAPTNLVAANVEGMDIGIGWTETAARALDAASRTLIFSATAGNLQPMAPETLTIGTTQSNVAFGTSTINMAGNFTGRSNATPEILTGEGATGNVFYIVNNSTTDADITVNLNVALNLNDNIVGPTTDLLPALRVAIFVEEEGSFILRAVLAPATIPATAVGNTFTGVASEFPTPVTATQTAVISGDLEDECLAAGAAMKVIAIAWFDGIIFDNTNAGQTINFGFNFVATEAANGG